MSLIRIIMLRFILTAYLIYGFDRFRSLLFPCNLPLLRLNGRFNIWDINSMNTLRINTLLFEIKISITSDIKIICISFGWVNNQSLSVSTTLNRWSQIQFLGLNIDIFYLHFASLFNRTRFFWNLWLNRECRKSIFIIKIIGFYKQISSRIH